MKRLKKTVVLLLILTVMTVTASISAFAADVVNPNITAGCVISPGETKKAVLFLQNQDQTNHSYKLSAAGLANNYEMYFSVAGSPVDSVMLQPGSKTEFDLNISVKGTPVQNEDGITVKAVREDGMEETMNLSIQISKEYAVSMNSMLNQIDILSGKSGEMTFSITNTGVRDLTAVKIEPELPYKWFATQESNTGIQLKPGETGTVKLKLDVPASQAAGNFTAKFSAVSNETKSEQISVPVIVKTSSGIAYWMAGILLLIVGFTLFQFKRHGRR